MANKREILLKKRQEWNSSENLHIDIMETTEFQSNILKFGISWGALGTVTPDRAREFSNKLNECISLVSAMNGFAEYTEGEKDD